MLAEPAFLSRAACTCLKWQSSTRNTNKSHAKLLVYSRIRPSHSMDDENKVYKQPVSTFAGRLVPEKAKGQEFLLSMELVVIPVEPFWLQSC
ncbi:uncharacterized protein LOC110661262 isoform X2 [Hevea brasiliensis]|uniref:uncharacterized protein LOC110661262 isoform X2 n=1 Tax=Hevea brasiliensis TaxID=3981 RepID=UPI0025FDC954|nr:uncharacterized protein LOC110661262 isoform X2 [Hevea brasiliensis]